MVLPTTTDKMADKMFQRLLALMLQGLAPFTEVHRQYSRRLSGRLRSSSFDDCQATDRGRLNVRHDPVFLQVTPQAVGVSKDIAQRRVIQPERLALLTCSLSRLLQTHLRPPAKSHVCDAALVTNSQAPGLRAARMNSERESVGVCDDISLFLRSESRNFL